MGIRKVGVVALGGPMAGLAPLIGEQLGLEFSNVGKNGHSAPFARAA